MPRLFLYASAGPELTSYSVDVDAATLGRGTTISLPANVQYAWPHASRRILYVASSDGTSGKTHHLTALRIDPGSGELSPHGAVVALPARPIHICTDGPSRHVLAAFNDPPALRVYTIGADGELGAERPQPEHIDPGIYPHQIRVSDDNRMAILIARGNDPASDKPEDPGALKVFRYDDGDLRDEVSIAPNGGYGFGPRHLDFHPTQPWVYVSLERQNRLVMFEMTGGRLSPLPLFSQTLLAAPDAAYPRQLGGTVHVHPNGRFVYAANRADATTMMDGQPVFAGGENNLAVYEIDAASGEPKPIQHIDTRGIHCRTFHIDPSGRMLVAAHISPLRTKEGMVPAGMTVFRIGDDGRLSYLRRYDIDAGNRMVFWMGMVAA